MRFVISAAVCLLALAGCGGGSSPAPAPPPPAAPLPPPVIGAAGGTITESSGAAVVFPAGAIETGTTFRIAMDSTGAPTLPAELKAAGGTYVVTPHGGDFVEPVEVRIPAPAMTLQPNQEFKIAKAEPGEDWVVIDDTVLVDGKYSTKVRSFSYFQLVVISYLLPIAQFQPLAYTSALDCGGLQCTAVLGPFTAIYTVTGNGGQVRDGCAQNSIYIGHAPSGWLGDGERQYIASTGGTAQVAIAPSNVVSYTFGVGMVCDGTRQTFGSSLERTIKWRGMPAYPDLSILSVPAQIDVVEGMNARVEAILGGGALKSVGTPGEWLPTIFDRAIIDWQRSSDGGKSWRNIAQSYQNEANNLPYGTGLRWRPWSVTHEFVATATDQAALIRVYACYIPPPPTVGPRCETGRSTRINVLQSSSAPEIVTGPRAVLIRTAETANFSVTATGQPAPTLQWQVRPANSAGTWTNVDTGTGATTANYTTAARLPSDNGEQYRVVATNAVGSAASAPVTVSVSDLDIAPTINTQPASISVVSGSDAAFAIDAYGTEALGYQWRFNGSNLAGANSPVLRLTGVTSSQAGSYSVTVSNNAGQVVSAGATLNVTTGAPAAVAPSIVTQPASIVANVGSTATFAVGLNGSGPFTFQWRRDGANIAGATSAVYTIGSVALPNAGAYSVVVNNSAGSVTSGNAVLDVTTSGALTAPTITSQPATLIAPFQGSGVIAVGAVGSGPLTYQWSKNGEVMTGLTSPVLDFRTVGDVDAGRYVVTITNSVGSVVSQAADLILLGAPQITLQPLDATRFEGEGAVFFVQADSSGLRYQWFVNGSPVNGAVGATLNVSSLVSANSGAVYSVMVYNAAGAMFSRGAVLTVQTVVAPTVLLQPTPDPVQPGNPAYLCVAFGGTPPITAQLQRFNGAWVDVGAGVPMISADPYCLTTPVLQLADNGAQFRYVASNAGGQVTTNAATVSVQAPPAPTVTNTTLVSRAFAGGPPNNISFMPSISADGRYVAFVSVGTDVTEDADISGNAYIHDMVTNSTKLINYNLDGNASSQGVVNVKLSSNGRYALFSSSAGDLVPDDTNDSMDIFRRDLVLGTTERVSVLPNGDQLDNGVGGNGDYQLDISDDGHIVMFLSGYDINGGNENNGYYHLFYRDLSSGFSARVAGSSEYSVAYSALSDDGLYIAYAMGVSAPGTQSVMLYDIEASSERSLLSFDQSEAPDGLREGMSISRNGRFVALSMISQSLLGSDKSQVVVLDRNNPGTLVNASVNLGAPGNGGSAWPEISGDGRYVIFSSAAPSLTNNLASALDPYLVVRDVIENVTTIASRRPDGTAVPAGGSVNEDHALSKDGTTLAFAANYDLVHGSPPQFGKQVFASQRP